jgi:formylglycine-generating enzyme required for sulfatase activity
MLSLQKRASGLSADVSQVILDETRKVPKPRKKPEEQIVPPPAPSEKEIKEEPKQEIPVSTQEEKEPEVKFTQQKPFTKLLDPASLSPNEDILVGRVSNPTGSIAPKKRQAKSQTYVFAGIGLLVLILGGIGLNYLFKNTPVATVTAPPTNTATPKPPTSTKVPFTPTATPSKTPSPTPTLGIGSTQVSENDGMTLLYVLEGEFTMGEGDEIHQVDLPAFWIDQTEVTNVMYAKCVDAGKCASPSKTDRFSNSSYANHPVVYVDWNMANAYCSWAERRLPTEAEWEKSARGTDGRIYPWGNYGPNDTLLNYNENIGGTTEVGKYPSGKSIYEAYDMAGNVWEWVGSLYKPYPYDANDGREDMTSTDGRVWRGGSWYDLFDSVRSAVRNWSGPRFTDYYLGFRCARSEE